MEITAVQNFKPIGKAVLHRIVGLRDNYTTITHTVPDCCANCPFHKEMELYHLFPDSAPYKEAMANCQSCENHLIHNVFVTNTSSLMKKYHNEKNKYGAGNKLKHTAILLFIAYHMVCTDTYGILHNVSIAELARLLQCSEKTIRYNNDLLCKNDYIYMSKGDYPGTIHICLKEYSSYFDKAKAGKDSKGGGRGFLTLSKETFFALTKIKSTTQLRIILKVILDSDENKVSLLTGTCSQSYRDMKRYLPAYCKRGVVKKAMDTLQTVICNIKTGIHEVSFTFNPEYNAKNVKIALKEANRKNIFDKINNLADVIKDARKLNTVPQFKDRYFSMLQQNITTYEPLSLNNDQINNLVDLSVEYSVDLVMSAVADVYCRYICHKEKIKNFGALIRETIRLNIKELNIVKTSLVQFNS